MRVPKLGEGLLLMKVSRLMKRQGIAVPSATLHRFAVKELDTGWMTLREPDVLGRRRRFRAWSFTSVYRRHRFVYPCFEETTKSATEACEAAWAFFGGVFHVLIPDNTKTIVNTSAPTKEAPAPKPRRPRRAWPNSASRSPRGCCPRRPTSPFAGREGNQADEGGRPPRPLLQPAG